MANFARGELVMYWFDTGAFGCQWLYGVVEKSGQKTITIRWESGLRNRVYHGRHDIRRIDDDEMRDDAQKKLARR